MSFRPQVLLVAACIAVLVGCSTAPRTTVQSKRMLVQPWQQLHPGMPSFQVERIMGKPRKVQDNAGKEGEVWVYERSIGSRLDPVAVRIVEEPWIDPIDGQLKMLRVPLQGLQRTDWVEIVEVELANGGVASVERTVVSRREFTE